MPGRRRSANREQEFFFARRKHPANVCQEEMGGDWPCGRGEKGKRMDSFGTGTASVQRKGAARCRTPGSGAEVFPEVLREAGEVGAGVRLWKKWTFLKGFAWGKTRGWGSRAPSGRGKSFPTIGKIFSNHWKTCGWRRCGTGGGKKGVSGGGGIGRGRGVSGRRRSRCGGRGRGCGRWRRGGCGGGRRWRGGSRRRRRGRGRRRG